MEGRRNWVIMGVPDGVRQRFKFYTEEEAKFQANERNVAMDLFGTPAVLNHGLMGVAMKAESVLKEYNKTLNDAFEFYLAHLKAHAKSVTVTEFKARIMAEYKRREKDKEVTHLQVAKVLEVDGS